MPQSAAAPDTSLQYAGRVMETTPDVRLEHQIEEIRELLARHGLLESVAPAADAEERAARKDGAGVPAVTTCYSTVTC